MTDAQTTTEAEIVSRYVTQHAPTLGGPAAVRLGRAAARRLAELDTIEERRKLLTQIYP